MNEQNTKPESYLQLAAAVMAAALVLGCGDGSEEYDPTAPQTCGNCSAGFICGGSGLCELNPTGTWVITATSGWVGEKTPDGSSWDTWGGLPDPLVCLTINQRRTCTQAAQDTTSPAWNTPFPAATATALQAGITVEYLDKDLASNDVICGPSAFGIDTEAFRLQKMKLSCTAAGHAGINATLTPQ